MKTIIILFSILLNFIVQARPLDLNDCHDESLLYLEQVLTSPRGKELLSEQFHITMLKMASLSNSDNLKTIEEYSKEWFNSLSENDRKDLDSLKNNYQNQAYLLDLKKIDDFYRKANYYKKDLRFSNKDASAFALSHMLIAKDSPFNENDISILWFAAQINNASEELYGKYSALYNKTSISSILTNYSGFANNKRPLTRSELDNLKKNHVKNYASTLNEIEGSLKSHLQSIGCLDEKGLFAGACKFDENYFQNLINVGLDQLSSKISLDELNTISLKNDLVARYKGKAIFEFLPISESNVEQAKVIETKPWKIYGESKDEIQKILSIQETINDIPELKQRVQSFAHHANLDNYVIVDPQLGKIQYFNREGQLIREERTEIETDDRYLTSGAGVYRLNKIGQNGELFIQDQNNNKIRPLGRGLRLNLAPNTPVVVLPKEQTSTLIVKDGELLFKKNITPENYYAYNYTHTSGREYKKIKITLTDTQLQESELLTGFLKALQDEKEKLMTLYNLTNDEYNLLAKFSFGVMKPESQMGTHWRYTLKETLPVLVSLKKWIDGNESSNSRGPTQLKRIPELIEKEYNIDKSDLGKPRPAAIATLGFCAELLGELKRIKKNHQSIDEDNMMDYLYYLFRGKRKEITKGTATPELNANIRDIKEMASKVKIFQEK
ncbi:hypothetical protein M899_3065 [Bacteriovorax sp. BSW11_IV]|uniref:hypothetical protein n=1 Tax=Bacteriovorax sp. BSW11_IV TaxID=1353529 RepID=UPI00038A13B2|nr:hypothetical protein [Bacteriovorax sp. BSW11_IV]EQC49545.1 hypothetical protein M899_3065 [Bacteriovorax sp. BSW11_IV]